ncbi:MAG: nucleotide exchange factor GrpE [Bacteroides sp.]|nr:nucleotide exchange factor GrpE [Bacteroides sp.]MDE6231205.1 nucleotide exchange factor GrpE [Muribaculaceae bacterium]
MDENNTKNTEQLEDVVDVQDVNPTPEQINDVDEEARDAELSAEEKLAAENEKLKADLEKEKKEYMFLMAEFDNFRKRTLREKSELIKNGAESAFKGLLPVVDDFERAMKAAGDAAETAGLREGMDLIYKKLKKYMEQNGVKEMDPEDKTFDADRHEAISVVPVQDEEAKGKILDTVEKGYTINDKVLRHAKVVVGQ